MPDALSKLDIMLVEDALIRQDNPAPKDYARALLHVVRLVSLGSCAKEAVDGQNALKALRRYAVPGLTPALTFTPMFGQVGELAGMRLIADDSVPEDVAVFRGAVYD